MSKLLASFLRRCILRGSSCLPRISGSRNISISCRGLPITAEDLFSYSGGHFLVNESQQCAKRHVRFDVHSLCDVVAAVISDGSPILKIDKMEGGYCKALLMTTENGGEVIAKIPSPFAGRARYSTASEAAVLQYVRDHTTIPVPKVLAWSADSSNPIGAEYIIMEKAPGVRLSEVWGNISKFDRLQLIDKLTKLESQLAALEFPAYGSLYHRKSIPRKAERILLDPSLDPGGEFCVGPACGPAWTDATSPAHIQPDIDTGPWTSLTQFGQALAERSIGQTRLPRRRNTTPALHGTVEDHINMLHLAMKLLPCLNKHFAFPERSSPALWHTDLHMGNIFVSPTDHTQIVSLIDWQSTSISPLFSQVRWPVFLEPPKNYPKGPQIPKLPENFEELNADEKAYAISEKDEATLSKAYEIATYRNNREAYSAKWELATPLRELYVRLGVTWEEGIVSLRSRMIQIFENWEYMALPDPCPLHFTPAEIASHKRQHAEYTEWCEIQDIAQQCLGADADGWISPEADLAITKSENEKVLGMLIHRIASEKSEQEVRTFWPFPP